MQRIINQKIDCQSKYLNYVIKRGAEFRFKKTIMLIESVLKQAKPSQVNLGANAQGVSERAAGVMVLSMQMMPDLAVASTS